ncbi:MAG: hypothetical protein WBL23_03915 [Salinisphaera sp.]|uniref:ZIP family metal transporter n=1 Tax=Salinisphaera sp. TaxID=1914330 RepID=UPI003C7D521F
MNRAILTAEERACAHDAPMSRRRWLLAGGGLLGLWLLMLGIGVAAGRDKLAVIGVMALAAMLGGWFGAERAVPAGPRTMALSDGLAAGAMLASACVFLLPSALAGDPRGGGLGVTAGLLLGIALDRFMDARHSKRAGGDSVLVAITLHAAAAGAAMGLAYSAVPSLSALLGIVIIAHKLPAGYVLARARQAVGRSRLPILLPACAVGLVAIPVALLAGHAGGGGNTVLAGLATGIFLHVGLDFARQPTAGQAAASGTFVIAAAGAAVVVAAAGFSFG